MLNAQDLAIKLTEAIQSGSFPDSSVMLSNAIRTYVMANGQAIPPTISYVLGPCTGAGWRALIPLASEKGVAKYIISTAVAQEFASSTKVIPAPHGVQTVPMIFNTSAQVSDLSNVTNFNDVWLEIAKAIVNFFSSEIK